MCIYIYIHMYKGNRWNKLLCLSQFWPCWGVGIQAPRVVYKQLLFRRPPAKTDNTRIVPGDMKSVMWIKPQNFRHSTRNLQTTLVPSPSGTNRSTCILPGEMKLLTWTNPYAGGRTDFARWKFIPKSASSILQALSCRVFGCNLLVCVFPAFVICLRFI